MSPPVLPERRVCAQTLNSSTENEGTGRGGPDSRKEATEGAGPTHVTSESVLAEDGGDGPFPHCTEDTQGADFMPGLISPGIPSPELALQATAVGKPAVCAGARRISVMEDAAHSASPVTLWPGEPTLKCTKSREGLRATSFTAAQTEKGT
ncbi:hypothetical protein H8959_003851 [Pygathrix nigripes]